MTGEPQTKQHWSIDKFIDHFPLEDTSWRPACRDMDPSKWLAFWPTQCQAHSMSHENLHALVMQSTTGIVVACSKTLQ
eukprot:364426-Chlamydomonas_euryale.AAC.11